jgi:cytochrome P450
MTSRRRNLPAGPSGWSASRFFVRGSFDGTPQFLLGLRRRYGPVTQFRLLTRRIWSASEPEFIRDVLVTKARSFVKSRGSERLKLLLGEGLLTSEAPLHLERRHLLQPAFHRERIAQYALAMVDETQRELATWRDGERIDAVATLGRLTLAIAARTLFGANVSRDADDVRSALSTVMGVFPRFLSPFSGLLDRLPVPATRRFVAARARLDAVIYRLIDERRREPGDRGDLLSMLLLARDDAGNALDDLAVRDEAMTIFIAGHETTANALVWSLYLLSQNPDVRSRLEAEVGHVLGGREARAEDAAQLTYTRMVLAEAMRLYPPAWIVGRRALTDLEVHGYAIRAGEVVLMSQYVVHRDPRFYAEPEAFRPERWAEPAAQNLPKFAYFPFGGGNRVCIGEQFAWMEGLLVLATLAQHARLDLEPGTPVDALPLVTLRPRHPMPMTVRRLDLPAARARVKATSLLVNGS